MDGNKITIVIGTKIQVVVVENAAKKKRKKNSYAIAKKKKKTATKTLDVLTTNAVMEITTIN